MLDALKDKTISIDLLLIEDQELESAFKKPTRLEPYKVRSNC